MTEKSLKEVGNGVYAFRVEKSASKTQIRELVEKLFKVKVASVNVATRPGKVRRVGKRMQAKLTPSFKLAYITVAEGSIDIFPKQ